MGGGGLKILKAVVNKVHLAVVHLVVPPTDLVPVDLVPCNGLRLGHFPVVTDEKVKFSKYAAEVIRFCQI